MELKKLFDPSNGFDADVVAGMGQYPGNNMEYFQDIHSWTVLGNRLAQFEK